MAITEKRQYIPPPAGLGNLPFSNAVAIGNTLYLAGHIGFDPSTQKLPADIEQEATFMLDALRGTLTRAGFTVQDIVSLTIFCPELSLYSVFNKVYGTFLRPPFPARGFIGSGPLLFGAHFEIQGIAVKGD
ncbi:MAG: RidA family protein [Candidatus Acidiferrales bacterium]